MKPTICIDPVGAKAAHVAAIDPGYHNSRPPDRIVQGSTYKDASTILVVPTRGMVPARIVQSWWNLQPPMNHAFVRLFIEGMEVGEAYEHALDCILGNEQLAKFKYVLTMEEDNAPPPDGLIRLIESINKGYDAVGGLYWTKGEGGQPMIYGNPHDIPINFFPQVPQPDTLQECRGLGMGFTLHKLAMFKSGKIERPFFKTLQQNGALMTQDLYFFQKAGLAGYKMACDTRVKVGHWDQSGKMMW